MNLVERIAHVLALVLVIGIATIAGDSLAQSSWMAHDVNRPPAPVVLPAQQELPVPAPPDALVLFDGSDLSQWESPDGTAPLWIVSDGTMISVPDSGYVQTREGFGDAQLHVEWATPFPVEGEGQGRGNSGIYLMGLYEVQVLDSYQNPTYADGQAGSIYGQYPPLYNVSLPPGEWQSFDIFFRRPRFSEAGALLEAARLTVLHNGVVVQNNAELWGPTNWLQSLPYRSHSDKLPLALQDHGNPVRYRNIWVRSLPEEESVAPLRPSPESVRLPVEVLDRYVGKYETEGGGEYTVRREGRALKAHFHGGEYLELVVESPTRFLLKRTAAILEFDLDRDEVPLSFTFHIGGSSRAAKKIK